MCLTGFMEDSKLVFALPLTGEKQFLHDRWLSPHAGTTTGEAFPFKMMTGKKNKMSLLVINLTLL